jgi:hypothetical protein
MGGSGLLAAGGNYRALRMAQGGGLGLAGGQIVEEQADQLRRLPVGNFSAADAHERSSNRLPSSSIT